VARTCNPRYSVGREEDHSSRSPGAKFNET
jgi:hypothetical protein